MLPTLLSPPLYHHQVEEYWIDPSRCVQSPQRFDLQRQAAVVTIRTIHPYGEAQILARSNSTLYSRVKTVMTGTRALCADLIMRN